MTPAALAMTSFMFCIGTNPRRRSLGDKIRGFPEGMASQLVKACVYKELDNFSGCRKICGCDGDVYYCKEPCSAHYDQVLGDAYFWKDLAGVSDLSGRPPDAESQYTEALACTAILEILMGKPMQRKLGDIMKAERESLQSLPIPWSAAFGIFESTQDKDGVGETQDALRGVASAVAIMKKLDNISMLRSTVFMDRGDHDGLGAWLTHYALTEQKLGKWIDVHRILNEQNALTWAVNYIRGVQIVCISEVRQILGRSFCLRGVFEASRPISIGLVLTSDHAWCIYYLAWLEQDQVDIKAICLPAVFTQDKISHAKHTVLRL